MYKRVPYKTVQFKTAQKIMYRTKKLSFTKQSSLRSPVGALCARRRFAAITGSNLRIENYPLLASSQHVGATAAVAIFLLMFIEQRINLGLPAC